MADDFMDGGFDGVALKFGGLGDTHEGTIVGIHSRQDKDMATGALKTWDDGSPKKVFIWELETNEGLGAMWVRGQLVTALRDAARAAGAKKQDDLIGAEVVVQHHELGEAKKGMSAPKLYKAKITLAPAGAKTEDEYDPFKD